MQIRQLPLRWRSRDAAEAEDAPWGDERQVAVWGQVSARTLYLVVALNVIAGMRFIAAWRQRQALREQEAPDDTHGAPDPML